MSKHDPIVYKLSSRLVASDIGEETVILDYSGGHYYGLEGVGSFVWSLLAKGAADLPALCRAVVDEYNVSEAQCMADLRLLLDDLKKQGLVEVVG